MSCCPVCNYIGPPRNCACQWVLTQVAIGKGSDPKVIEQAQHLREIALVVGGEEES